jgi:hypothetical protein
MIGIGEPASLSETTGALHAFNIPLVSVAPDPADQSLGAKYSNVLTTAPDMAGQARVSHQTLHLLLQNKTKHAMFNFVYGFFSACRTSTFILMTCRMSVFPCVIVCLFLLT